MWCINSEVLSHVDFVAKLFLIDGFVYSFLQNLDQTTLLLLIGFIIWTLTSIGLIFDNSSSAWASEFVRLALFTLAFNQPLLKFWNALMVPSSLVTAFYGISLLLASIGTAMQMFTPKSKISWIVVIPTKQNIYKVFL